jgi:hypothetical protein
MGFWRRRNYGQFRDSWNKGIVRSLRQREAVQEILEELPEVLVRGTVAERVPMSDGRNLLVHNVSLCENDETCCIHKPSDHPMVNFPQLWREDVGLMERICPHGIGHPDPDDLTFKKRQYGSRYESMSFQYHGCDGCCAGSY